MLRIRNLEVRIAMTTLDGVLDPAIYKSVLVNWIRIDKSFMSGFTIDPASRAVVRAIMVMGYSLDINVTAEGQETLDQLCLVTDEHCDAIQAYYYDQTFRLMIFQFGPIH